MEQQQKKEKKRKRFRGSDKFHLCDDWLWLSDICFYIAIALSLVFVIPWFAGMPNFLHRTFLVAYIVAMLGQFTLQIFVELKLYPDAEDKRIAQLFGKSYDNYALYATPKPDYHTVICKPGIEQLLKNSFDNAFWTYEIAKARTTGIVLKNAVGLILFLGVAVYGLTGFDVLIALLSMLISPAFLYSLIRHAVFVHRCKKAYEGFRIAFAFSIPPANQFPFALFHTVQRERALAAYGVPIDPGSKFYMQLGDKLNAEWENIQREFGFTMESDAPDEQKEA